MAKRERDRFAALAAEIGSSRVVASIDRAIEENERERIELFELRKLAVRRHGEPEPAGPAAAENSASPKADQRSGAFDGTMAGLIRSYLADDRSPYHALRHVTKSGYSRLLDRIVSDCGDLKLSELTGRNIQDFYDGWTDGGAKRAMGHSLVTMVRLLIGYGAAAFEDKDCLRLSGVLRTIRFSPAKPRGERMTAEYAKAIIRRAHGVEMPSIALAQAFQFDCA